MFFLYAERTKLNSFDAIKTLKTMIYRRLSSLNKIAGLLTRPAISLLNQLTMIK
jgi:hypothetical protein